MYYLFSIFVLVFSLTKFETLKDALIDRIMDADHNCYRFSNLIINVSNSQEHSLIKICGNKTKHKPQVKAVYKSGHQ